MAVTQSDIHQYKSANGDSAGGSATATFIAGLTKNNYFADISDVERLAGGTRIRKSFLGNDHATDSLVAPKLWIDPDVLLFSPTVIGLGFDDTDDDNGLQGNMSAFSAAAQLEALSSAADTRSFNVYGIDNATGEPAIEALVLTGTTPVLSTVTWSKVYAVQMGSEHGTNTVTVKQGAGGTVRGTIAPNREICFLWVAASSEATALWLPDLVAGGRWGIWEKQTWPASTNPTRPNDRVLNVKETS